MGKRQRRERRGRGKGRRMGRGVGCLGWLDRTVVYMCDPTGSGAGHAARMDVEGARMGS